MFNLKSVIVPLHQEKIDERGYIKSITNQPSTNTSIIMCKPGSIRANHYHLNDWHYMFILDGEMDYFFFDNQIKKVVYMKLQKNQIIYTPPKEVHATYFEKETTLIVVSYLPRDQRSYENDTRRVEFINESNLEIAKQGKLNCQFTELK